MIYYIIFLIFCIFSLYEYFAVNNRVLKFYSLIVFLFLVSFAGLRYDTGFDYLEYEKLFKSSYLKPFYDIDGVEYLFGAYMKLINIFNFEFFIFFTSFITLSIRQVTINKFSPFPLLSLLIYYSRIFLFSEMGQIRQGMAMSILFFSIPLILENKKFKLFLLILIASLIHSVSLIFLLVFIIKNFNLKIRSYFIIIGILLPFVYFDSNIIFEKFFFILPAMLKKKFIFYSAFLDADKRVGINQTFLLKITVFLIGLFYYKYFKTNNLFKLCFNLYFIGLCLFIFFNSFPQMGIRGSMYFLQFDVLLIPFYLFYLKKHFINIFFLIFVFLYSLIGLLNINNDINKIMYIPYHSIFNKEGMVYKRSIFYLK